MKIVLKNSNLVFKGSIRLELEYYLDNAQLGSGNYGRLYPVEGSRTFYMQVKEGDEFDLVYEMSDEIIRNPYLFTGIAETLPPYDTNFTVYQYSSSFPHEAGNSYTVHYTVSKTGYFLISFNPVDVIVKYPYRVNEPD